MKGEEQSVKVNQFWELLKCYALMMKAMMTLDPALFRRSAGRVEAIWLKIKVDCASHE